MQCHFDKHLKYIFIGLFRFLYLFLSYYESIECIIVIAYKNVKHFIMCVSFLTRFAIISMSLGGFFCSFLLHLLCSHWLMRELQCSCHHFLHLVSSFFFFSMCCFFILFTKAQFIARRCLSSFGTFVFIVPFQLNCNWHGVSQYESDVCMASNGFM